MGLWSVVIITMPPGLPSPSIKFVSYLKNTLNHLFGTHFIWSWYYINFVLVSPVSFWSLQSRALITNQWHFMITFLLQNILAVLNQEH